MTEIHFLSLVETARCIRSGELTSSEVTEALLERITALDPTLMSYAMVLADRAMAQAQRADAESARGISRGPLHGVPIGVKDLCYTSFAPTTAGMKVHKGFMPPYNATIVDRLELAGAVTLGKLKMTEGAYTSHHPEDPTPRNPWNHNHWVGSSSTGSGVATSAGLCYASIGSDTGGSIRFPSATCGLTGLKPTWGRVSRHGVFPLADSLDHVGPMARSAADCAAMLGVMAGADPNDPTTLTCPVPDYLASIASGVRGRTIGIDRDYATEGVDVEVVSALRSVETMLVALGARVREVRLPPWRRLVSQWIAACAVETAAHHHATYPSRKDEYGPALALLIEEGLATDGRAVADIMHERLKFNGGLAALFDDIDMLLIPAMPMPIPDLDEMEAFGADPEVLNAILRYTAPFDFSGSPTITMPMGIDRRGMPLSFQLVGPHAGEETLLQAGHTWQSVTDWHTRRPPGM